MGGQSWTGDRHRQLANGINQWHTKFITAFCSQTKLAVSHLDVIFLEFNLEMENTSQLNHTNCSTTTNHLRNDVVVGNVVHSVETIATNKARD